MPLPDCDPVLIVGAGPTGLVLALWLTRLGTPVRIIDKTAEPGTTSRALAVQARTLEFYSQVGLADAVVAAGIRIEKLNFWVNGARAAHVMLGEIGEGLSPFPFVLVYPQDAHERFLIERLSEQGVRVERQTELLRFEQHDAGVRARLQLPDGSEENCDASYLAGCDGASSTVREALGVGFPGGTYSGQFFVADVDAVGPAANDELHVDLEDADFVLVFPLRPKGRLRLVGIVHDPVGRDRDALGIDDVKGRAIERLKLTVERANWFSTYRVHHRVANEFRVGRAFLLGDAAHIHSPVGGQGMNTGIGDAVNLAWKLAAVLSGRAGEDLLETYERERIVFARQLVATTDRAFILVTARDAFAQFVRTQVVPRLVPMLLPLSPVRRFLFKTVSQIKIAYPHSSLSAGTAGQVRGGDRLPWVSTGQGQHNFTALESLDWQAHVYGEPRSGLAEACVGLQLPLHAFVWQAGMARAGLKRSALYLVRPDGYVALADPEARAERLLRFFEERGLRAGAVRPGGGLMDEERETVADAGATRVRLDDRIVAELPKGEEYERVVSVIQEKTDLFSGAAADAFKVPSPSLLHSRGVGGAAPARSRLLYFTRLLYLRTAELLPAAVRSINEHRLVSFALFTRGVLETAAVAGYHEQRLAALEEGATELPADYLDRLKAAVLSGKFDWRRFIADPTSRQALVDDYDANPKKQQPPDAAKSIMEMVDELGVRLGKSAGKARGRIQLDYAMLSDMCHPSAGGNLLYLAEAEPWMRAELQPQSVTLVGVATMLLPCLAYSAEAVANLIADLEQLHDRLAKMNPTVPALRPAGEGV